MIMRLIQFYLFYLWITIKLDRFTEIERENRLLLEKMTTIMTTKP